MKNGLVQNRKGHNMKIKKVLILLLILFINNLLYSTDIFFTAINNENFYSKKSSNKASGNLVKGKKYKSLNKAFWTQYGLRIKLNDNNEDIWVNAENIISNNGISEFDSDLIYKYEPYWESEIHLSTSSVFF